MFSSKFDNYYKSNTTYEIILNLKNHNDDIRITIINLPFENISVETQYLPLSITVFFHMGPVNNFLTRQKRVAMVMNHQNFQACVVAKVAIAGIFVSVMIGIVLGMHNSVSEQNVIATESFDLAFAEEPSKISYDMFENPPKLFGNNMIIASPGKSVDGVWGAGNISVIDPDTNSLLYTIRNPESDKNISFGRNIGISDSYILVGVQGKASSVYENDDDNPAKIYVFDGKTGKLLHTIKNPNNDNPEAKFSSSFSGIGAIGDTVVAGSYFDDLDGFPTHVMYVFDGKTGSLLHTIDSPIPGSVSFGETLETFDGKIAVYTRDENPNDQKIDDAIYVFDGKNGSLLYAVNDPIPDVKGDFGRHLIIADNNIVVGVPLWNSDNHHSGLIHVFDGNSGSLLSTIKDPADTPRDFDRQFGQYMVPVGDNIAVRSNESVYIFEGSTGELLHTVDGRNLSNVEFDMIVDILDNKDADNIMIGYFFVILVIGAVAGASVSGLSRFKIRK